MPKNLHKQICREGQESDGRPWPVKLHRGVTGIATRCNWNHNAV
ncbi:hypothetical protein EZS27_007910 [termite gut metagenome]|uniref:Uncharacterized protein n=1 Tax=termite gut metagenome TaxID=433724 RepID=A0A5J4SE80_9ZZZZ